MKPNYIRQYCKLKLFKTVLLIIQINYSKRSRERRQAIGLVRETATHLVQLITTTNIIINDTVMGWESHSIEALLLCSEWSFKVRFPSTSRSGTRSPPLRNKTGTFSFFLKNLDETKLNILKGLKSKIYLLCIYRS